MGSKPRDWHYAHYNYSRIRVLISICYRLKLRGKKR